MRASLKCRGRCRVVFLFLALLLLYPATGFSLDNNYWQTGLNFHFYPPGARAIGMGGAFVALADDATAAATNPAGLAQLTRPQAAIEMRHVSIDSEAKSFPWSGVFQGNLIQGNVTTASDVDNDLAVSFGAITTPLFNNLFNLSVFYDKPLSFSSSKSVVFTLAGAPDVVTAPSTSDFSVNEAGLSIGKSFCDGKLMLGIGVGLVFFDAQTHTGYYWNQLPPEFNPYSTGNVDQSAVGASVRAGILVKPIDKLRLGVSYSHMPRFDYTVSGYNYDENGVKVPYALGSAFDVPDNLAFGAAYNVLPNWVVIVEGKYVRYSELMATFLVDTTYVGDTGVAPVSAFSIDDIFEIHFGTEYVINAVKNVPIALRAGLFYEPAHDLKYNGNSFVQTALFDGGDDIMHYTFGTGVVLLNHVQIDVGADFTTESKNVALSMVYQY